MLAAQLPLSYLMTELLSLEEEINPNGTTITASGEGLLTGLLRMPGMALLPGLLPAWPFTCLAFYLPGLLHHSDGNFAS